MKKIGTRKITFTHSRRTFDRAVWKDETGKHFVTWCGQKVEVAQVYKDENATAGWYSVEAY